MHRLARLRCLHCGYSSRRCLSGSFGRFKGKDGGPQDENFDSPVLKSERKHKEEGALSVLGDYMERYRMGLAKATRPENFSFTGLKRFLKWSALNSMEKRQAHREKRLEFLGPDLMAAYYLINFGGKVKFKGDSRWFQLVDREVEKLPNIYNSCYKVEEIDMGKAAFLYEGLYNLERLSSVRYLSLADSPTCDDFILDSLTGYFNESLEVLDLSRCQRVTFRGLSALCRLRNLKRLILEGMEKKPNFQLVCMLLEDELPGLVIEGVSLDVNLDRSEEGGLKDFEASNISSTENEKAPEDGKEADIKESMDGAREGYEGKTSNAMSAEKSRVKL